MKIAIYQLNQLGDFLFSLPLLHSIKKNFPQSSVTLLLPTWLKPLTQLTPFVDNIIERPKIGGVAFFREIRDHNFDWWISLSRSPQSYLSAKSSLAKRRTGFSSPPFSYFLTESIKQSGPFNINAVNSLCEFLELERESYDYRGLLSFSDDLQKKESDKWKDIDLHKTITIAPGSSSRKTFKRRPKDQFAKLIDEFSEPDFTILLTGSKEEYELIESIKNLTKRKTAVNLAGKLSLTQLAYLLSKTRLLICNDSGAMHLASVFETPLIALFGPTSPARSGPYNKNARVIIGDRRLCEQFHLELFTKTSVPN
ncbi:MAG: hypothetical protein A3F16_06205 [Deltaproteobacteria bacterium RIFCSPHIGHO2_12_FULL_43_9]|nr:MAG: hypothetical protein A3F16_06205 [Deltaproteobacteria bacterium RIFCSPHIGHO2_12_FULL_43_9]